MDSRSALQLIDGRYEVGVEIGRGNFGVVYRGRSLLDQAGSKLVALKLIPRDRVDVNVLREIRNMLAYANHPFIVSLVEVVLTPFDLCLVQDLASGGELFSLVASKGKCREEEARGYFQQIIFGLEHLHSNGITHRDLKLENVLLSTASTSEEASHDLPRIQICDLGYSKGHDDSVPHSTVGTPAYLAPEILSRGAYDGQKVDIWSCGVMLYVMLCGVYPFEDPTQPRNWRRTMERIVRFEFDLPGTLSPNAADLLRRMLTCSETRISLSEIKLHPFFQPGLGSVTTVLNTPREEKTPRQTMKEIETLIGRFSRMM